MRNQFRYLGLKRPILSSALKSPLTQLNGMKLKGKELEEVVHCLWSQPYRECKYFAMDIVPKTNKLWTEDTLFLLEHMLTQESWWDTVDLIASNLCGVYFKQFPHMITPTLSRWDAGSCFWLHRTSIIFQLKYGDSTDEKLLFTQCEKYMHSDEFFLQKAIGWALRQYSKTRPEAVRTFLDKNRSKLSGLSIREASKYI